jgi:hypothetical protein
MRTLQENLIDVRAPGRALRGVCAGMIGDPLPFVP